MEKIQELLDEANEKIINKLDNTIGLSKNKEELRNIIRYHKVMQEDNCDIDFENYNIIVRNESTYKLHEELIAIIAELYCKNGIISNPNVVYIKANNIRRNRVRRSINNARKRETEEPKEEIKEEGLEIEINDTIKTIKEIEEGIIVIDASNSGREIEEKREEIQEMINKMKDKSFIILENHWREGEVNAIYNEFFSWSMKIDEISTEEKERYIKKFVETNKLVCSSETIRNIADNPFYIVKNKAINLLVNCKINKENNVDKILKKEENIKKKEKNKTGLEELDDLTGLEEVKEQLKKVINYIKISKNRKNMPMLHMCFNGNPGTGKTTVARILGKIFSEEKILSEEEKFVEAQRVDLIGQFIGDTAPKTQRAINRAIRRNSIYR